MARSRQDRSVSETAGGLLSQLDELTDQLVQRIRTQIEIYRSDLVGDSDLRRSVRQNLEYMLHGLSDQRQFDLAAPELTGRERAEQGVPLPEVLEAFRIGFAFVWEKLLGTARASGPPSLDVLLDAATDIWALADDYSRAMTESFRAAKGRAMIESDRQRSMLVAALLDGPPGDQTAWEVAQLVGWPFDGSFLVVAGEREALGQPALPNVEDRLGAMDVASAWRTEPGLEIGILWFGRRRTSDEIRDVVVASATGRVGLSPVFSRLDQAPRALRYARVALETLLPGTVDVRQLDDSALTEAVMGNLETTRRFVDRVLGKVLELAEEDRSMLIATADAWLDARGSNTEAARILYCHANTVRYRLRRLEELLGGSIDDPTTSTELTMALKAIRIFPALAAGRDQR